MGFCSEVNPPFLFFIQTQNTRCYGPFSFLFLWTCFHRRIKFDHLLFLRDLHFTLKIYGMWTLFQSQPKLINTFTDYTIQNPRAPPNVHFFIWLFLIIHFVFVHYFHLGLFLCLSGCHLNYLPLYGLHGPVCNYLRAGASAVPFNKYLLFQLF